MMAGSTDDVLAAIDVACDDWSVGPDAMRANAAVPGPTDPLGPIRDLAAEYSRLEHAYWMSVLDRRGAAIATELTRMLDLRDVTFRFVSIPSAADFRVGPDGQLT